MQYFIWIVFFGAVISVLCLLLFVIFIVLKKQTISMWDYLSYPFYKETFVVNKDVVGDVVSDLEQLKYTVQLIKGKIYFIKINYRDTISQNIGYWMISFSEDGGMFNLNLVIRGLLPAISFFVFFDALALVFFLVSQNMAGFFVSLLFILCSSAILGYMFYSSKTNMKILLKHLKQKFEI